MPAGRSGRVERQANSRGIVPGAALRERDYHSGSSGRLVFLASAAFGSGDRLSRRISETPGATHRVIVRNTKCYDPLRPQDADGIRHAAPPAQGLAAPVNEMSIKAKAYITLTVLAGSMTLAFALV